MLAINQPAPTISARSLGGDRVELEELRARGPVLVKFHRFSGCPVAQAQISALLDGYQELGDAGIETIVILHSSPEKVRGVFEEAGAVHILADREKRLYRAYGAQFSWRCMLSRGTWAVTLRSIAHGHLPRPSRFEGGVVAVPADFLIDRCGTIVALSYGRHYGDSWSLSDALAAAERAGVRGREASEPGAGAARASGPGGPAPTQYR